MVYKYTCTCTTNLGNEAVNDLLCIIKYEMTIEITKSTALRIFSLSSNEVVSAKLSYTLLLELGGISKDS